ncbi:MAG: thiamine phosphate synthase, partial [Acidobacteria bacterium]|nr:thiamine phosphate synthase [Acidobacteriota bacterium]
MTDGSPRPSDPLGCGPIFYPIIDTEVCAARGIDPLALALACLRGGARLLQLRQKAGSGASFVTLAERLVAESAQFHARVIVNDRADIARLAGAAGVHVGQDDLDVDAVFRLVGNDAIVGLSTHDTTQIDAAIGGRATYLAVGPVFGTTTKETGYGARGLDL